VKVAAFAHSHGDRAGEQADASGQNVQNQERESHASTSFEHRDCYYGGHYSAF